MHETTFSFNDVADALAGVLCPLSFFVVMSYLLGLFVFGPLHARAAWTPPQTRFRIADIITLLVQLQIGGGLVFAVVPAMLPANGREAQSMRIGAALLAWLLIAFWWWTGVRMLAKARVDHGPHRLMFMAVILPLGYLTAIGIVLTPAMMGVAIALVYAMLNGGDNLAAFALASLILANAAVFGSLFFVRWYSQQLAERARDDVARGEGIEFEKLQVRSQTGVIRPYRGSAGDERIHIAEEPPST